MANIRSILWEEKKLSGPIHEQDKLPFKKVKGRHELPEPGLGFKPLEEGSSIRLADHNFKVDVEFWGDQ